jgi:quercetin dioxygenase-like cupin family protein
VSRFVLSSDVSVDEFDWGEIRWRCTPPVTGAKQIAVLDVTIGPGSGHDFHKHPGQEEMIVVKSGRIEQWIEQERHELGPGDSVYIDADVVHASFVRGDEPALLQVVLGPAIGDGGYELVDVSAEAPWSTLRS